MAQAPATKAPIAAGAPVMSRVSLNVNGAVREIELDARTTLLDAAPASHGHQEGLDQLANLKSFNRPIRSFTAIGIVLSISESGTVLPTES